MPEKSRKYRVLIPALIVVMAGVLVWYRYFRETIPQYVFWQVSLSADRTITDVLARNGENVWIQDEAGTLFYSADNAESWNAVILPEKVQHSGLPIRQMYCVDIENRWVINAAGEVFYTKDGGEDWQRAEIGNADTEVHDIRFFDKRYGVAAAAEADRKGGTDTGSVWLTEDGGKTWMQRMFDTGPVYAVSFPDPAVGYAASRDGVLKTTNGGESWLVVNSEPRYRFTGFRFIDERFGYARGEAMGNARNYVTTDGGRSWKELIFANNPELNDFCFTAPERGWAVGDNGLVLFSNDGGVTWTQLETGVVEDFHTIRFLSERIGLIGGAHGALLKIERR